MKHYIENFKMNIAFIVCKICAGYLLSLRKYVTEEKRNQIDTTLASGITLLNKCIDKKNIS